MSKGVKLPTPLFLPPVLNTRPLPLLVTSKHILLSSPPGNSLNHLLSRDPIVMERSTNTITSMTMTHRLAVNSRTSTTTITTIAAIPTTSIPMPVIKRESSTAVAPANLPSESGATKLHIITAAKGERVGPVKRNMVIAPIPDRSVNHAVSAESHDGTNDAASNDVVPVMELVDGQRASDQDGAEHGSVDGSQLPERRVVVGEDLELGVEVKSEEDEAGESSGGVTRRHRLERIIDLVLVAGADILCVVNLPEPLCGVSVLGNTGVGSTRDVGLADRQEVRAQAADEPLDEDLEDSCRDQGVEKTEDAIVDVPEGADADLHAQDDEDGDHGGEEGGEPDGNDFLAHGVGELRVDDLAVGEGDGEGA